MSQLSEVTEALLKAGLIDEEEAKTHVPTGTPHRHIPLALRTDGTGNPSKSPNWNVGVQNAKHYLEQSTKLNKPWIHCPRIQETYSEFIVTDRAMAESALEYNKNIRRVTPTRVDKYTRQMAKGRWIETDEAISIDEDGFLRNGQHRLLGVIESNRPTLFYWSFNVNREANFVYDSAAPRRTADRLGLVIQSNIGNRLPSICRAMMRGISPERTSYSDSEIAIFAAKHGPIIEWAARACGPCRADISAVVAKVALYHGIDSIADFAKRFRDRVPTSKDDPAKRLWEWISRKPATGVGTGSMSGLTTYKKALGAVFAELNNRTIKSLYERQQDVFEWGRDWEVPR